MGVANNDAPDDGDVDNARRRRSASPTIGLRIMGPRTIGPRMMGIADTYVVDDIIADDWAAYDARR